MLCLHESFVQIDNNSFLKRANFLIFTEIMMQTLYQATDNGFPELTRYLRTVIMVK